MARNCKRSKTVKIVGTGFGKLHCRTPFEHLFFFWGCSRWRKEHLWVRQQKKPEEIKRGTTEAQTIRRSRTEAIFICLFCVSCHLKATVSPVWALYHLYSFYDAKRISLFRVTCKLNLSPTVIFTVAIKKNERLIIENKYDTYHNWCYTLLVHKPWSLLKTLKLETSCIQYIYYILHTSCTHKVTYCIWCVIFIQITFFFIWIVILFCCLFPSVTQCYLWISWVGGQVTTCKY